jgi:hypothetical protein
MAWQKFKIMYQIITLIDGMEGVNKSIYFKEWFLHSKLW